MDGGRGVKQDDRSIFALALLLPSSDKARVEWNIV